jgi:hypothetical protein
MSELGLQASHLLLIRTNLGYGTILMVACTQGCSASDYYCHSYYKISNVTDLYFV